jgi:hypothetical protein
VGSEMCIRDSSKASLALHGERWQAKRAQHKGYWLSAIGAFAILAPSAA